MATISYAHFEHAIDEYYHEIREALEWCLKTYGEEEIEVKPFIGPFPLTEGVPF